MKLKTWAKLGIKNVAHVAAYRLLLKAGLHPAQKLQALAPEGELFRAPINVNKAAGLEELPWMNNPIYFGFQNAPASTAPPRWERNPFVPQQQARLDLPWWKISDFAPQQGDIKYIWEASRFEWAVNFAIVARNGDSNFLTKLNQWCVDWWKNNPPFFGPNWKCAQEASIRTIRLCVCADILSQFKNSQKALIETIAIHLARVKPTLRYAQAQENNHATTEAAAMIIGGLLLRQNQHPLGSSFIRLGFAALEKALAKLIMDDGSFSQNSTNYHRFMLDTVCLTKLICDKYEAAQFSEASLVKIESAIRWLNAMTDPTSGQAFNLGHNDSAYLLPYPIGKARDFRMTIGFAQALFSTAVDVENAKAAQPFFQYWNIEKVAEREPEIHDGVFDDGGFCLLNDRSTKVLLRVPKYRFRPAHCDGLHVDVFVNGENILRDSGSISYISKDAAIDLALTRHHNTVQFDENEQMPRLSRFLWGDWLAPSEPISFEKTSNGGAMSSAYKDRRLNRHWRKVELSKNHVMITDDIAGNFQKATLRWHLAPGPWREIEPGTFANGKIKLRITSVSNIRFELSEANQGLSYGVASTIPFVEASCNKAAQLITELRW